MHVIAPPLVTPGNRYCMVITCSNNSLAVVISFDVNIVDEAKKDSAIEDGCSYCASYCVSGNKSLFISLFISM